MKRYLHNQDFVLESGKTLPKVEVAYHTYGHLNPEGDNVIWVFHALTANSDVADWWSGLFGKNKLLDPDKYFIVCANVLGSCYGTTGPASVDPLTQEPYLQSFPNITIRDIVGVHQLLARHLRIEQVHLAIGGSMGGQQLLEWNVQEPHFFEQTILLATNAQHSPWGIAFNTAQRMALEADPTFLTSALDGGKKGLMAARAMALLSYRQYDTYALTQKEDDPQLLEQFAAESYQRHQGNKLALRFNAHCYYTLSKAMDSHHLGRNRGSVASALGSIHSPTMVLAIDNDVLFPVKEQLLLAHLIPDARFHIVQSDFGHDGFLIETAQINQLSLNFIYQLQACQKTNVRSANQIVI